MPAARRPQWLRKLLDSPTEDGYYAQLSFTPPRTLFRRRSALPSHGTLRVVQHGPWRVRARLTSHRLPLAVH